MFLERWWRDVILAARGLVRRPLPALALTATIAVSLGAATALFTIVNALAWRPLSGVDGAGLVNVYTTRDGVHQPFSGHSYPTFEDLGAGNQTLQGLAAFAGRGISLDTGSGAELVGAQLVSGSFFPVLGTRAARGRLLAATDDRAAAPVVVVSHSVWQERLGGDPGVLGRTIRLNGEPFSIVGVAEPGFRGHFVGFPADVFVPLLVAPRIAGDFDPAAREDDSLELIGRLREGVGVAQVQADLARLAARLAAEHPDALRGAGVLVRPWSGLDADLEGPVFGFVGVLVVVALLVLLVACVNVAGLLTGRMLERRRETALRLALGAGRTALCSQLAAETLLPFLVAGALGLAMAGRAADALHAFLPSFPLPIRLHLEVDWRVTLFALTSALGCGLVFGLLPGLRASRLDVAVARVDVRTLDWAEPAGRRFFEGWRARIAARGDVAAAALVRQVPLGFGGLSASINVPGHTPPQPEGFAAGWNAISAGYFETLRIPLLAGRDFDARDSAEGDRVAIVSRATAARWFPSGDAVGGVLLRGEETLRVIGVVGDVASRRLGETTEPFFYVPFAQSYAPRMGLVARGTGAPPLEAVGDAARELARELPLLAHQTLDQHALAALFPQRIAASVAGSFAVLGLVLSVVGLYALVASQVSGRRRRCASHSGPRAAACGAWC